MDLASINTSIPLNSNTIGSNGTQQSTHTAQDGVDSVDASPEMMRFTTDGTQPTQDDEQFAQEQERTSQNEEACAQDGVQYAQDNEPATSTPPALSSPPPLEQTLSQGYKKSDSDSFASSVRYPVQSVQARQLPNQLPEDTEELKKMYLGDSMFRHWQLTNPEESFVLEQYFASYRDCKDSSCNARFLFLETSSASSVLLINHRLIRDQHDFNWLIEPDSNLKLVIAENICPCAISILGLMFHIHPSFWTDHFGGAERPIKGSVDPWLELLTPDRVFEGFDMIHFSSIIPREISSSKDMSNVNWNRIGNHDDEPHSDSPIESDPIAPRKVTFIPPRQQQGSGDDGPAIAFFHQSVSVYLGERHEPIIGIILVDPIEDLPKDLKATLSDATLLPNGHFDKFTTVDPVPLAVIPTLSRMALALNEASRKRVEESRHDKVLRGVRSLLLKQWALVHAYVSRDLHEFQSKLQNDLPDFQLLPTLLKDLFLHRQRCIDYKKVILKTRGITTEESEHFKRIFDELLNTIERQVNLLTTLVSIRETQQGIDDTHAVGRLTRIATIYLPFSTVATVLAMPDNFAPGASKFWVYWVASLILAALVIILLPFYEWVKDYIPNEKRKFLRLRRKQKSEKMEGNDEMDQNDDGHAENKSLRFRWGRKKRPASDADVAP